MLRSFRELTVWQKSMQLATGIYKLTQGFPREETRMGDPKMLNESESLSQEIGKMLYALLEKLRPEAQARSA